MAVEDGVEFAEPLAPVKLENGVLYCKKMVLGDMDASGRRAWWRQMRQWKRPPTP